MSDTITPEDLAALMKKALVRARAFVTLHGHENTLCVTSKELFLFHAALEAAEKELAGADADISELRDEIEDSRGTEKDAPNVLCAIARLVGVYEHCQAIGDDIGQMALEEVQNLISDKQKAEAEVARLTAEVEKAYLRGTMYVIAEVCRQGLETNVEEIVKIAHGMGNWSSYCVACECYDLRAFAKVVGKWGLSEMEHRKEAASKAVAGEGKA